MTSKTRLDVLMATTSYPVDAGDWRGRFIHELAASLDRTKQARVMLWGPEGRRPAGVVSANSTEDGIWLQRMVDSGGIAHLLRRRPPAGLFYAAGILSRLRKACLRSSADVYHVNWLQLALGLPDDRRPAYVAVLGSDFGLLRMPGMTAMLRRAFARRRTLLAPNAGWMGTELTARFGDVAEVRPNPFGVSPKWFDLERDRASPAEWLVVSRITRNKLGDLIAWGEGLFDANRRLRLLGPMQEQVPLPGWIEHAGPTDPDALHHHWFPRATGLLTLSRHDEGRPQIMIEAMAAGLPVIASRVPAHADLICHGETGWLVDSREELAGALRQAEAAPVNIDIGFKARDWIRDHVGTWDDCALRCVTAYEDLTPWDSVRVG
jgi:glycosyltransferase involved in cell wall biosynthesis